MLKKLVAVYAKMSRRERLILYGTALVLGGLAVDQLVVRSLTDKLHELNRRIHDEETAIKQSLLILVEKNRIQEEGREFMAYSVEAGDPEAEMTGLLREIEAIADRSSVSLLYVKPGTNQEGQGTRKYVATLECESQMEQVAAFFHAIESSPKLLKIEKYDIQPKSRESSIARCVATISKTVLS